MNVIEYCTEEVDRQNHDIYKLDGIERVGWMLNAWAYALEQAKEGYRPTVNDVISLGKIVEPKKNKKGIRKCGVYVHTKNGIKHFPKFDQIALLLETLFESVETLKPMDFYKELIEVHPFIDGNGRTGKVILNWINGTLLSPIFPPDDLFGYPIRNP